MWWKLPKKPRLRWLVLKTGWALIYADYAGNCMKMHSHWPNIGVPELSISNTDVRNATR